MANKTNPQEVLMPKIQMTTPLVEMDGDEMTRVLWRMIKDRLHSAVVGSKRILRTWASCTPQTRTKDRVTVDAGNATKRRRRRRQMRDDHAQQTSAWPSSRS